MTTIAGEKIYSKTFQSIAGDIPLDQVTTTVAERWRHERLIKVKPVTVNDERRVLSHIFNCAVDEGLIATNPFKKLKKLKEQQKRLYMTPGELEVFFGELDTRSNAARNAPHRRDYRKFKLFCEVLLNTGMRRSELLKLRTEHIDLQGNIIHVEEAKGKKRREIPMTARVREIVQELGPVLFSDLTKDQVTHKFIDVAKHLRLQGAKLHSLRHTFGTYMIAMGFDVTVVKELLGHEDIKTTLIYAKADKRLLERAIERFSELAKSGYKMVTKFPGKNEKPLIEKE